MQMEERGKIARDAGILLAATNGEMRNEGLKAIAKALEANQDAIIAANQTDMKRSQDENLGAPLLKRLTFDAVKINDVIQGIYSLMELTDPLGATKLSTQLDEGLDLYKVTCPIGVIGVIFESRPDAFVQISTLCLKSGNSVLLKGGREALETNRILAKIIHDATVSVGLPVNWIQNLETREDVTAMLALDQYIDLIIPRGSNSFVKYIMTHSNIPVMGHADGICHIYVHDDADLTQAIDIIVDSKTQYVAACNTLETLLVNENIAQKLLPALKTALDAKNVQLKGDTATQAIIPVEPATEEDWKTEYLDYILSIRIVPDLNTAITHINTYGSGHTDVILTTAEAMAKTFMTLVDSAGVFWNCSTRFSDGFRFGFGAEVGISTSKLHARGPVGLDGLLSYKYKLLGHGQLVADYASGKSQFTHVTQNTNCPI
ncbi:glutamate-5-semialdehyde dehydrogenase [Acetobacterium woodii]|uniref:Gamma-glutamyl phosphate reductase n=1 Tax=Acetobacterium woodii (strain ATCC 29683 / DSM 1030 / JCM 2381 / KCTC 1655 / WB1) TaxID=931626 RepID=H6LFD4_ACEWD|nr:glutamate-5-semialdehyde dehydrogenase [Acetobacterium woodii]AFA49421.1 gamma-glutamyl phosphate reductase ProA [Acetobacterium woodii DSM 1030]